MSALSVLYLVLPFPLAFIIHDAEETLVQHRWMLKHTEDIVTKFPRTRPMAEYLLSLDTKAFAIAAIEELLILLAATCYVLIDGIYAMQIWSALFLAFSVHLIVHIIQAICIKGYVPGLVSTILLLPYSFLGVESIWYVMNGMELALWGTAGIVFMIVNLRVAHWLGKKNRKNIHTI